MSVTILLLAAGKSSRMNGPDKLAREIDGESLLHRSTREALNSGAIVRVVTTLDRAPLIADLPANIVEGGADMSASLRAGLEDMDDDAVIIALADMPDITTADYKSLISAHKNHPICRATTADGTPGHPVLFDRKYFDELSKITGDVGPKSVLRRHSDDVHVIATQGNAAITDLDTEEDWKNYWK